jgi:hypothetical protein
VGADLPEVTIINFIIGDFESAWNALAHLPGPLPRGNFLFARQAMILLEVACRLCNQDKSGQALRALSEELAKRDRRYFTLLPGACWTPQSTAKKPAEFTLPSQSTTPACELLAALFDLIRNGQAHQYQQIRVELTDKKNFQFSLTGAEHQLYLHRSLAGGRPRQHLAAHADGHGDIWVTLCTDVLFLDIRDSIRAAQLLNRNLSMQYLQRPRGNFYKFDAAALAQSLRSGGH